MLSLVVRRTAERRRIRLGVYRAVYTSTRRRRLRLCDAGSRQRAAAGHIHHASRHHRPHKLYHINAYPFCKLAPYVLDQKAHDYLENCVTFTVRLLTYYVRATQGTAPHSWQMSWELGLTTHKKHEPPLCRNNLEIVISAQGRQHLRLTSSGMLLVLLLSSKYPHNYRPAQQGVFEPRAWNRLHSAHLI